MKLKNPRIERLKELMSLEERRSLLQFELDTLVARMTNLKDALFEESQREGVAHGSEASAPRERRGAAATPESSGRMRRGALREQILTALEVAGISGIKVTELARAIGIKPVNVYSWFHSARDRYPEIKKLDGGHYRLDGKVDRSSGALATLPPARGSAAQKRATPKREATPRSRRGELTQRILTELGKAGTAGVSVRDLAAEVGAPYKNIYIWFATTGKKSGVISKVKPGYYRLHS